MRQCSRSLRLPCSFADQKEGMNMQYGERERTIAQEMATDVLFMRAAKDGGEALLCPVPHYNLDGKVRGACVVVIGTFLIASLAHLRGKLCGIRFIPRLRVLGILEANCEELKDAESS